MTPQEVLLEYLKFKNKHLTVLEEQLGLNRGRSVEIERQIAEVIGTIANIEQVLREYYA